MGLSRCAECGHITRIARSRRRKSKTLVSLEETEEQRGTTANDDRNHSIDRSPILEQLYGLIQRLNRLDRQVILLYLEGMDAAFIAEMTGISSGCMATKISPYQVDSRQ
jgi:RNA polymerase sigma-70 factor (ECF subfamily)